MKIGDIIEVNEIGHKGTYRIVFVYNDEPRMFLVTPDDDCQAVPRCYMVLQESCTLVEERDPPEQNIKRRQEVTPPIIKTNYQPHPGDEKSSKPKEYVNASV